MITGVISIFLIKSLNHNQNRAWWSETKTNDVCHNEAPNKVVNIEIFMEFNALIEHRKEM
jgi:hypothetical protein